MTSTMVALDGRRRPSNPRISRDDSIVDPLPQRHQLSLLQFTFRNNIRRGLRHQHRRSRRRRRHRRFSCRKAMITAWAFLGLCSYGLVGWLLFSVNEKSSSSVWMAEPLSVTGSAFPQQLKAPTANESSTPAVSPHLGAEITSKRLEDSKLHPARPSNDPESLTKELQIRSKLNNYGFGWIALPACIFFLVLSIHRVWNDHFVLSESTAPSLLRESLNRSRNGSGRASNNNDDERLASIFHTLYLINQDRQERGEPIVSLDSYLAFQRVLSDRSIWIGLAERFRQDGVIGRSNGNASQTAQSRGISPHRLDEICPYWTITMEHACLTHGEECSICLANHEVGDVLRSLPCSHSFHKECIDRWMVHSTYCPMCKYCLAQDIDV